ncbi:EAL domain-containing protein [Oribacterium sp. WCC10]|uniref:EAL domain-containing protein n=1 Tax=Oribacterium sp. WCC10 TaxID=1855343 RepID=UPI0008EA1A78|nr:EAL domain-containing protein [Oribacterium sp. WCC10]SFG18959.1 EAL domain, c-di-GMP-specific phosphodiesterase class I (or its enzymatically inactive variant) [Oribacterium sp. WCC10]
MRQEQKIKENFILHGLTIMPGGFFIYRGSGDEEILYTNAALLKIYDCETEEEFMELTGGTFPGMVHEDDVEHVLESIQLQIANNVDHYDRVNYRIITKNGSIKYVEDFGRYYIDPDEGPLYCVFISDMETMPDALTGLPSRWAFLNRAETYAAKMLGEDKVPAIIAFNLSGMKGFNARNGVKEGDRFLCIFADLIRKYFDNDNCSRFGEDNFFAFAPNDGLEDKLKALIEELYVANAGKTLPVKIGTCIFRDGMSANLVSDYARMACEAQKGKYGSRYGSFDEKMGLRYTKAEYILSHIDQALNEGWVTIYLQPVIRTLTGRVCGFEALARWVDPVYGFISPGDFVPLLEENSLSYKLDTFIIKRVAELQARSVNVGNPIVPVSVNISRSDFDNCKPVDIITSALSEYNLRRNVIAVEITETALMNDTGIIKREIDRFHEAGIEVWMDDFGSGYSSLNVIKDYQFDEIKIDMLFLRDFSEKSKTIVTMAVKMAKELGIHTLAEGVETEEHLEFLKEIGCERIQGYYYSKPLPVSDIHKYMIQHGLMYETREEKSVYDRVGLVDVVTDQAIALLFYDKLKFKLLYGNEYYHDITKKMRRESDEDIEAVLNDESSITSRKFHELAAKTMLSHREEFMTFIANDRYFFVSFKKIADSRKGSMLLATIDGKRYEDQEQVHEYDRIMRNIVSIIDCVYLLDFKEDTRTVMYSNLETEKVGDVIYDLHSFYQDYKPGMVHPDDERRWHDFINPELYKIKINERQDMCFSDVFRVKSSDGSYKWMEFMVVLLSDVENRRAMVCIKPSSIEKDVKSYLDSMGMRMPVRDGYNINDDLMEAIRLNSGIRFFWKDKKRRFIGVSNAFLDYYGFKSQDVVVGKTDEDVGWHVDDGPFMSDEERVLQKGEVIHNNIGQNIVDGVTHYIAATKFPVYHGGEITGLMGYMIDIEQDVESDQELKKESLIDPLTGFMNTYGQMVTITQLDDNLRTNGEDFAYIVFDVPEFEEIREDYGREIAEGLVKEIADKVVECFGSVASIFRVYGCNFGICKRNMPPDMVRESAKKLLDSISQIREIDGRQVMVHGEYAYAHGSEKENVQEVIELAKTRLMKLKNSDEEGEKKLNMMKGYVNYLPLPYVVAKPIMDKENKNAIDIEYIYVNNRYCEVAGKSASELVGKTYTKVFEQPPNDRWIDIGYRAAYGEYIHDRAFSYSLKHWMNFIAAPSNTVGTFSTVFINMEEIQKLYGEAEDKGGKK